MRPDRCPWRECEYASAFAQPWQPVAVPAWGSFILSRPIPGSRHRDAIGCYPLAAFAPDADIASGLDQLRSMGLVSIVAVPDPLASPSADHLTRHFTLCRPYKTHYGIDRTRPIRLPHGHRSRLNKSNRLCHITVGGLAERIDRWCTLYQALIARYHLCGISAFSSKFFHKIAALTDFTVFSAWHLGEIVAMSIWAQGCDVAYYFLNASAAAGYSVNASYALMEAAIHHFKELRWLHLGGSAGNSPEPDGLSSFKRGFANAEFTALLCGAILDERVYATLSERRSGSAWFPAYRNA
jgi:hypothetical protein